MSEYHTEGFVKTVSKDRKGVKFTVEAVSPYLFESREKKEDGSVGRKMLLMSEDEASARIYAESAAFNVTKNEFIALLISKANHMKVRLSVDEKAIEKMPLVVSKLELL